MKLLARLLVAYALALLALAALAAAHGGTPPEYNNPDVSGPCFTGEHNDYLGTEFLTLSGEPYGEGESAPYVTLNGNSPDGYFAECGVGFPNPYLAAGELGASAHITLHLLPLTPLEPGTVGMIVWSTGWTEPTWTPFGWSLLDQNAIYAVWTYTETEKFVIDGEWIAWRRHYVNPTDPALDGTRVFYAGVIVDAATGAGAMSGTWMLMFNAEAP